MDNKPTVITLKELCTTLSISRSMAYLKFSEGSIQFDKTFPKPFKLSVRRIGFLRSQMDDWVAGLTKAG